MHIEVAITIAATPQHVWDVVEPIEHHTEWMADAVSITFLSTSTRGVGTEFECLTKVGPLRTTDIMRVTEWEPGRVMGIEHRGVVSGAGRFTIEPLAGALTRFTWTEELRFPWWMGGRIGEFFARPILQAVWRRNLRRLCTIAERPA